MKQTISTLALDRIKQSNKAIAHLMIHFNRGQWTIESWMNPDSPKHHKLTEPAAVEIIKEQLGLSEDEILQAA